MEQNVHAAGGKQNIVVNQNDQENIIWSNLIFVKNDENINY